MPKKIRVRLKACMRSAGADFMGRIYAGNTASP